MIRPLSRAWLRALLASVALSVAAPAFAAPDGPTFAVKPAKPAKKHVAKRVPKGTGFLPGYRTPEQIERQQYEETQRERRAYYRAGGPRIAYWRYPQPQFYRGRWNGGSFGPCWTSTPIGYQWNCGK